MNERREPANSPGIGPASSEWGPSGPAPQAPRAGTGTICLDTPTITIPARPAGLSGAGRDGWVAATLAEQVPGCAAEVTLRSWTRLDQPVEVVLDHGRTELWAGAGLVADAVPASPLATPPTPGDATWAPREEHVQYDGTVAARVVWTALLSAGAEAIAVPGRLDRMCARVVRPVRPGRRYAVVGEVLRSGGVRRHAVSAVYAPDGTLHAMATATWIEAGQVPSSAS